MAEIATGIAVDIPLDAAEIVDWALVLDKRGKGTLFVLRPNNVLLAWPGQRVGNQFTFGLIDLYPFVLTEKQVQAVYPGKDEWCLDALQAVVEREIARVNAVRD